MRQLLVESLVLSAAGGIVGLGIAFVLTRGLLALVPSQGQPLLISAYPDPRILAFLVVWFGLNALFGIGSVSLLGVEQPVAWQAHIGGFLAGLLLFPIFDPVTAAGAAKKD